MIKDKVVLITGASSGIGAATAMLLAKKGAKLVLGARREEKLQHLVKEIESAGGTAVYQTLDVTDAEANKRIVQFAKDTFGRLDVVFLNAGLMPNSPLSELKTNEWNQMVDVNIKGVLNGIAAVLPTFKAQKSGHVITTSSVAGLKAYPGGAVYGATKWAVRDLMEVLRMESAQENSHIRTQPFTQLPFVLSCLKRLPIPNQLRGWLPFTISIRLDQIGLPMSLRLPLTNQKIPTLTNLRLDQPTSHGNEGLNDDKKMDSSPVKVFCNRR